MHLSRQSKFQPLFLAITLFTLMLLPPTLSADNKEEAEQLLTSAETTLDHFMRDPETETFRQWVPEAKGIFIAPAVWQAGIGIGGSGGAGLLLVKDEKSGEWAGPAFYELSTGSIGLQLGVKKSEIIMLVLSSEGLNALLSSNFKFGAGSSISAGPVGTGSSVHTTDLVSFTRSKGLFGGLVVDGGMIAVNDALNSAYYGTPVDAVDILVRRDAPQNPLAKKLIDEVIKAHSGSPSSN